MISLHLYHLYLFKYIRILKTYKSDAYMSLLYIKSYIFNVKLVECVKYDTRM